MNSYNWIGMTNANRHEAIIRIKNLIHTNNGSIIAFNRFSDLMLSLTVEINEQNLEKLNGGLENIMNITKFEDNQNVANKECLLLINITFGKGTGDLKVEVPKVPG